MIVDGWGLVFLGAIAVATVVMAVIQVCIIVYASRLATRVDRLADTVEHEIKPLLTSIKTIGDNAVQVSSLAVAQLERADRLFADVTGRVEQVLKTIHALTAAREGVALIAGLRAAFAAFRNLRQSPRRQGVTAEEEEALFIG